MWEFVGGKVEPGETKEQALIRECQEKLAITLDVGNAFMNVIHEYPDIIVHLTLFNATIAKGIPKNWNITILSGSHRKKSHSISSARRMRIF